jgi:ATPase subunit of ABC transporter with duplicated ATPase domains
LLNHTTLRLRRGRRYGICAGNGKGKSTLMKAIRDGKVEGFPPQDQLRTLMVEHALQGEDATLPIIDFIATDKNLIAKGTKRESIRDALLQVGFSDEKQGNSVGSLSGGWKMKLELARAMLIGADILLLDEPTNHLGEFRAMSVLRNIITDVKFLSSYLARILFLRRRPIGRLARTIPRQPDPDHLHDRFARQRFPGQRLYRHYALREQEDRLLPG